VAAVAAATLLTGLASGCIVTEDEPESDGTTTTTQAAGDPASAGGEVNALQRLCQESRDSASGRLADFQDLAQRFRDAQVSGQTLALADEVEASGDELLANFAQLQASLSAAEVAPELEADRTRLVELVSARSLAYAGFTDQAVAAIRSNDLVQLAALQPAVQALDADLEVYATEQEALAVRLEAPACAPGIGT